MRLLNCDGWLQLGCALVLGLSVQAVFADVFSLGPNADNTGLEIRNLTTSNSSNSGPAALIAGNAVSVDPDNNWLYFAVAASAGSEIRRIGYTQSASASIVVSVTGVRITHLEFDAEPVPRLLALGLRESDDAYVLLPIQLSPLSVGAAMPIEGQLILGVSAFRASDDRWFVLSKKATGQRLEIIDVNSGAQQTRGVPDGLRIAELVIHPTSDTLYALVDRDSDKSTFVATLTVGIPLGVSTLGSADTECCFVLAGPAAIDSASNRLYALTRPRSGTTPTPPVLTSFDLSTGARNQEAFAFANALFVDSGVNLPELFSDSFE